MRAQKHSDENSLVVSICSTDILSYTKESFIDDNLSLVNY